MEIFVEKAIDQSRAKLATRLAFIAAGFGVACWAPLVPYAKARCQVGDGTMGLILLLLGAGSIVAMPIAANLCARFGSKPVVLSGGVGLAIVLPLLSIASSPITLGTALFVFGASLGSLDVAMNLHAVDVERASERPLMSGFHALFSIGGFLGSGVMTALLSRNIAPSISTILSSAILVLLIALALPRMLSNREATSQPFFAVPRGAVLLIALLAAISFLVEGALLDWSALLLVGERLLSPAHGGLGYMLFSIAMTFSRFIGDRVVGRFGDRVVLTLSGLRRIPRVLLPSSFTIRIHRDGKFHSYRPWSRKHRAHLVQACRYAAHDAKGACCCRPDHRRLWRHADGACRNWLPVQRNWFAQCVLVPCHAACMYPGSEQVCDY